MAAIGGPSLGLPPSPAELAAAFERGTHVRAGAPVTVRRADGSTWVRDIAGAERGDPDPWYAYGEIAADPAEAGPGVVSIETATGCAVSVAGLPTHEVGAVYSACAAVRHLGRDDAHDATGDAARLRAGRIVATIEDVMVRSRLADLLDCWIGLVGEVVDDDPEHGTLHEIPDDAITARVLVVRCPSTGRTYALTVPTHCESAREARTWTLHGVVPDVET